MPAILEIFRQVRSMTMRFWTVITMTFRSKYGNRKVTRNGVTYDSKKEADRHAVLKLMERGGLIYNLNRQVKYVLIPAQYEPDVMGVGGHVKKGKLLEREVSYVADFTYTENGRLVVEDVKGYRTPEYKIKRKLMLYLHGIRIKET